MKRDWGYSLGCLAVILSVLMFWAVMIKIILN
jgi:hypothetical protein